MGKSKDAVYFPSYNVRTPIIEINLNGFPLYPHNPKSKEKGSVQPRLNFQSFDISMPMGGLAETTISGSLSIFAKNPSDIIDYLDVWADPELKSRALESFPVMTIRFGWALSDSEAVILNEVKEKDFGVDLIYFNTDEETNNSFPAVFLKKVANFNDEIYLKKKNFMIKTGKYIDITDNIDLFDEKYNIILYSNADIIDK